MNASGERVSVGLGAAQFVTAEWADGSPTRPEIWEHFHTVLDLYRAVEPSLLRSVWVGGSFTTLKLDPDDIDMTVLLGSEAFAGLSGNQQGKVKRISAREPGGLRSRLREKLGLRVDCFAMVCAVAPMPWLNMSPEEADYFRTRGMWDDWWLRVFSGAKGDMPTHDDALPVRGYLEVDL